MAGYPTVLGYPSRETFPTAYQSQETFRGAPTTVPALITEPVEIAIDCPVPISKTPLKQKEYNKTSALKYAMWRKVGPLENEVKLLEAKNSANIIHIQLLYERNKTMEDKLLYTEDIIRVMYNIINLIENPNEQVKSVKQMAHNALSRTTKDTSSQILHTLQ